MLSALSLLIVVTASHLPSHSTDQSTVYLLFETLILGLCHVGREGKIKGAQAFTQR